VIPGHATFRSIRAEAEPSFSPGEARTFELWELGSTDTDSNRLHDFADSQSASQHDERMQTKADHRGQKPLPTEHAWTTADSRGFPSRGLQNRLRGAAEASWVGSIPIHPRPLTGPIAGMATATASPPTSSLDRPSSTGNLEAASTKIRSRYGGPCLRRALGFKKPPCGVPNEGLRRRPGLVGR